MTAIGGALDRPRSAPDEWDPQAAAEDLERLRREVADLDSVVVAFSGGADSALLAAVCHQVLGDRALAITAVSPSLAASELANCERLTSEWGMRWATVQTDEMESAAYRRNDPDRCFHCKSALMDAVVPLSEQFGAVVALGVNLDDLDDHRPGQRAARERGAVFPLVEAGLTKDQVRACSRLLGLETWDKPAAACLASRVPHGTEVSVELLSRIERAEAALVELGASDLRVRHHDDVARIEVPSAAFDRVVADRERIVSTLRALGYRYVTLDLEGFRSGSMNPPGSRG
jgi:uncharacterized protein